MCRAGIVSYAECKELLISVVAPALQTVCLHGQVSSLRRVCGVRCVQGCWAAGPHFLCLSWDQPFFHFSYVNKIRAQRSNVQRMSPLG